MIFVYYIMPIAKQSVRFTKNGIAYQPKEYKEYTEKIKIFTRKQLPSNFTIGDEPVVIDKLVYLFPPKKNLTKFEQNWIDEGHYILKDTKPDITDNLNKALFDALEGIVYPNDSKIVQINKIVKAYHKDAPRIILHFNFMQSKLQVNV